MWWLHQRVCRQIRERVRRQVESWPQAKPAFLEEPTHSKLIFDHEKMHKWVNIQIMVKLVSEKTIWSRCDDLHCQQLSYNVLKKEKDTVFAKDKVNAPRRCEHKEEFRNGCKFWSYRCDSKGNKWYMIYTLYWIYTDIWKRSRLFISETVVITHCLQMCGPDLNLSDKCFLSWFLCAHPPLLLPGSPLSCGIYLLAEGGVGKTK